MGIRETAEKLWNGEETTLNVHPVAGRFPDAEEIADGILYYKGTAARTPSTPATGW